MPTVPGIEPLVMKRTNFLALSAVGVLAAAAVLMGCPASRSGELPPRDPAAPVRKPLRVLSVDEVAARIGLEDPRFFVYDNNSRERYDQGHLPGAIYLPYDEVTAEALPKDLGATLVFYCANES